MPFLTRIASIGVILPTVMTALLTSALVIAAEMSAQFRDLR
jgi:hypothetical protein